MSMINFAPRIRVSLYDEGTNFEYVIKIPNDSVIIKGDIILGGSDPIK